MRLDEDIAVEEWRVARFTRMGFGATAIRLLQEWRADVNDTERLMIRDGERTSCTQLQALRILQPEEDNHVLGRSRVEAWVTAR